MKISINIDANIKDTEITVSAGNLTPEIERIIAALRMLDQQISVTKESEVFILDISDIIYIESVDRKTFVYTAEDCFESRLKLYEMESQLCSCGFMRVSKSCLVNIKHIRSLKREFNHKLLITLENSEQIIVSRQYADKLRNRLGVI